MTLFAICLLSINVLGRNLAREQLGGQPRALAAVLTAVCAVAVAGCLAMLLTYTLLRRRKTTGVALWKTLVAYTAISLALSVTLARVGDLLGVSTPVSVVRLVSGVGYLVVLAYVLDTYDTYRRSVTNLSLERQRLAVTRDESLAHIHAVRARLQSMITANIGPRISAVRIALEATRSSGSDPQRLRVLSEDLRSIASDWVRPLSHDMADQRPSVRAQEAAPSTRTPNAGERKSFRTVIAVVVAIPNARPFRPVAVAVTFLVALLSNALLEAPRSVVPHLSVIAAAMGSAVIVAVLQWVIDSGSARRRADWEPWQRTLLMIISFLAIGLMAAIPLSLAAHAVLGANIRLLILGGMFGVVGCSLTWATIGAISERARHTVTELAQAVEQVRHEVRRCEQEEVRLLLSTSTALHGEIQSRLAMTALLLNDAANRLVSSGSDGEAEPIIATVALTLSDAERAVASITATPVSLRGVRQELSKVADVWEGVAEVRFDFGTDSVTQIDNSQSATQAVVEIVREAVANAIRHGDARNIDVLLVTIGGAVELTVRDDGICPSDPIPGLGFDAYERLSDHWVFHAEPGGSTAQFQIELGARSAR